MESVDVVVVGAGIAGLTTAVDLVRTGHRVVVLEARDRVGGRTTGLRLEDGTTIEMGGQWFGPTQTEVLALADHYGLKTYPTFDEGDHQLVWGGKIHRTPEGEPNLPEHAIAEVHRLKTELESMAATLDLERPWAAERAEEWDSMTLASWLDAATDNAEALAFWRFFTPAIFAAEVHEMSLLHFLFYLASGGMVDMLMGLQDGAQDCRLVGGSHLVSEAMADELGDVVRLSAPVHTIEHNADGAVVKYDGGEIAARRVVVTLPPALAGRLRYSPPMPPARDQLTQQVPMGSVIKMNIRYDRPFWRESGLAGNVISFDDPLTVAIDNTPHGSHHGVLAGFLEGVHARRLGMLPAEERRAIVLDCLVRWLGPEAGEWLGQLTLGVRAEVPLETLLDTIQPYPTFSEAIFNALRELEAALGLSSSARPRSRPPSPCSHRRRSAVPTAAARCRFRALLPPPPLSKGRAARSARCS